jgi:hypothetical protein
MIFLWCISITIVLPSFSILATGQTSKSLQAKFGAPAKSADALELYEIVPKIQMTVKYAASGEACEVEIRQKPLWGADHLDMDKKVGNIIADIIPLSKRGKRIPNGYGIFQNCITSHNDEYEKVMITYFNEPCGDSYRVITVRWKRRLCTSLPASQPNKRLQPTPR